jgi:cob(I)alamin adenosyltransferase
MPRITKVYTRSGDDGSTSLGGGQRVPKHAARVEAYGTVDELNSMIGAARATGLSEGVEKILVRIQNELFNLGADLCVPEEKKDAQKKTAAGIGEAQVDALEGLIDKLTAELGPLENFILPGGSMGAALIHVARTICRRAERRPVALATGEAVGEWSVRYLNRLSDALFVLARLENKNRGIKDRLWASDM